MTTTDTLLADLADVLARASKLAAQMAETLTPAYHPERMGYLSEVRAGDRVLFAGGWREVAGVEHRSDAVRMWFTDPVMDPLTDQGTHAIRIQKRADEQQADALHRRDNGGL